MLLNDYTRLFSRWAKHADFGVAALVPQVKRFLGDPTSFDTAIEVLDDVDDDAIAEDLARPSGKRALILCVDSEVDSGEIQRGAQQQDRIVVAAFYLVKGMKMGPARREAEIVLEAAAANQRVLALKTQVEGLGPPSPGAADRSFREFGPVRVMELKKQTSVRTEPGAGSEQFVGVLFSVWTGLSLPFTPAGV